MTSQAAPSFLCYAFNHPHLSLSPSELSLKQCIFSCHRATTLSLKTTNLYSLKLSHSKIRASVDEKDQTAASPVQEDQQLNNEVEESVKVLKKAAKTRKVPADEVLSAFSVIERAKLDPSGFLNTLGGTASPGKTWMLTFTAEKKLTGGRYFPITAVQRFDAAAKRIENGVYLGPVGCVTFEGRFSWSKKILAFIFERIRIKIGPFNPVEFNIRQKEDREPGTKDPFFIWYYVDEEIAVARGEVAVLQFGADAAVYLLLKPLCLYTLH